MDLLAHRQTAIYLILGSIALFCWILLWWCPYFEARKRRHSRLDAIWVTTFFSALFFPLWFVAMIWAYTEDNRPGKRRS